MFFGLLFTMHIGMATHMHPHPQMLAAMHMATMSVVFVVSLVSAASGAFASPAKGKPTDLLAVVVVVSADAVAVAVVREGVVAAMVVLAHIVTVVVAAGATVVASIVVAVLLEEVGVGESGLLVVGLPVVWDVCVATAAEVSATVEVMVAVGATDSKLL